MPVPPPVFNPPFNILRCSHAEFSAGDLGATRAFYEDILGLKREDGDSDQTLYFRSMEEQQHHSLVFRQADGKKGQCLRLGFKLAFEEELDKAFHWFKSEGQTPEWVEDQPFQGRVLHVQDRLGTPLEFYYTMEKRERLTQKYIHYKGVQALRIDHFNLFSPEVQNSIDFYTSLGFRMTEYTETDGDNPQIWAAWMHRKGGVHDVAFTNGRGPRLHHIGFWTASVQHIIHLCDVMATSGYLENMERGPGRHGISNAFFLYLRDPDGHRMEMYTSDYLTVDTDLEPLRWSLTDTQRQTLWGMPAPLSWFEEGSEFPGVPVAEPVLKAEPIIAH